MLGHRTPLSLALSRSPSHSCRPPTTACTRAHHTDKPTKWILCAESAEDLAKWRGAFERLAQTRRVRQNASARRKRSSSKITTLRNDILKDIKASGDVDGDLEYFRRLSLAVRLELMSTFPDFNAPALRRIDTTVMYATAKAEGRMFHTWHSWISVVYRAHARGDGAEYDFSAASAEKSAEKPAGASKKVAGAQPS